MSRKKLILMAVALLAVCIGVVVALVIPGDHADHASSGSTPVIFASLIPVYVAVFASRRPRKGCAKEKNNG
ncbi:MAG TPA: hypothetical protein VFT56_06820 [Sphingomonas sp.]|nr:hypothetical protein [Sphingomonas sp.]